MNANGRPVLPFVTNFDTDGYPLHEVLPRILASDGTKRGHAEAVTGKKLPPKIPGAVENYLTALGNLGLRSNGELSAVGKNLALAATKHSADEMYVQLRRHLLEATPIGLVLQALQYLSPSHGGDSLISECARTLEVAFGVEVPNRRQSFPFLFKFLRSVGLLDADNIPVDANVKAALRLDVDSYLSLLARITPHEKTLLETMLRHAPAKWVPAEDVKRWIRSETGEILEVGRGGKGIGARLEAAKILELRGGNGKGARDTEMRLKGGKDGPVATFLRSPWARAYLVRASYETGGLLANLDKLVGGSLPSLLKQADKDPNAGELLEMIAARIAFSIGCHDITIRSRMVAPGMEVEGEKDVIATIPKPFPTRLLVQCKDHEAPMGTAVLYRELAIALMSTNVRTILFFSKTGYTPKTRAMQRLCMQAFPFLNIALFDGEDLGRLRKGDDVTEVVYRRIEEVAALRARLEGALDARQLRHVAAAMEQAGVDHEQRQAVVEALWAID